MKNVLPILALLTACDPSSSSDQAPSGKPWVRPSEPRPSPLPPAPIDQDPGKRIKYQPDWLSNIWSPGDYFITGGEPGNYGILPGEEPIADSMYRFWESARENWSKSLNHGFIPKDYLNLMPSGFENILWTDKTNGQIPGFEKLKPVLNEMTSRCPQLALPELQAPLEVVWATKDETTSPGQFFGNRAFLRQEKDRVVFDANLNARPKLNVRAEWLKEFGGGSWDGWKWPNQTFREQTGGKSWAEGGSAYFSIDQTFAHEYGHFLIQAWALNNGRNTLQTQWFAEGFAEIFRVVCWGDMSDRSEWIASEIKHKTGTGFDVWKQSYLEWNRRYQRGEEYTLGSLGDVITYKSWIGEYVPSEFFGAILITLGQMEGVIIDNYPVRSTFDGAMLTTLAPWSGLDLTASILRDAPRLWTKQELLSKFCDNYDCGLMRPLVEAESEGLRRDEW